jgi:signal transduction histidine kinase
MAQRQIGRGDAAGAQARLQSIVDQTDRLTQMLESFLDAARLEAGNLPMRPERVSLRDVVEQAEHQSRLILGEAPRRSVETSISEDWVGDWDHQRIVRAVRALLTNAVEYGKPNEPVRVIASRTGDRVRMIVDGGGNGPDDDEARHLFERFFRGRSAAESGHAGSGLGLFTARGIAQAHGGDVRWLTGDRFEIELPLANP